jgi:hypothetical protein
VSRQFRKCGSLDVSQTYGPPLPVTGMTLLFALWKEHNDKGPEIGISCIDLAQLSRFYLKTVAKSNIRKVKFKKQDDG